MIDRETLKELHGIAKAKAINGEPQKNMICGSTLFPTSKYWTITKPPTHDAQQLFVSTRYADYNDPIPVVKELDMMIAKIQQLKISFCMAWQKEFAKVTLEEDTSVLEEGLRVMDEAFEKSQAARKTFAGLIRPLCEKVWSENVQGPKNRLKAIGVSAQDYAELLQASDRERRFDQYPGSYVSVMYKGTVVVEDARATYGNAVPIYRYDYSNPTDLERELLLGYEGNKGNSIEQLELERKQQFCGKGHHAKNCRCHEGWPIKK